MNAIIPVDVAEPRPGDVAGERTAELAAGGTEIAVAALWARPVATATVVLGATGVATGLLLGMLQLFGDLHLTTECHPAVTVLHCVLVTQ